ncbi:hypothetical protein V8G54_037057, partial [Vigna mungo]
MNRGSNRTFLALICLNCLGTKAIRPFDFGYAMNRDKAIGPFGFGSAMNQSSMSCQKGDLLWIRTFQGINMPRFRREPRPIGPFGLDNQPRRGGCGESRARQGHCDGEHQRFERELKLHHFEYNGGRASMPPSSSGSGHLSFKEAAGIRLPLG